MCSDSLTEPSPALATVELTVPAVAGVYIDLSIDAEYENSDPSTDKESLRCENCGLYVSAGMEQERSVSQPPSPGPFPMAAHEPVLCQVESVGLFSGGEGDSKVLDVWLSPVSEGANLLRQSEAGDTIAVLCRNRSDEVAELLRLLDVDVETAHRVYRLTSSSDRLLPSHLSSPSSLCHLLTHCVQIRHVPSRQQLAALADHTADTRAKRRLRELSSRQGGADYSRLIRVAGLHLSRLLSLVPSCRPPIPLLLQTLPRLAPRIYSLAGGVGQSRMRLLVGVVERPLPGLFSYWLDQCTRENQCSYSDQASSSTAAFSVDPVTALLTLNDNWQDLSVCEDLERLSLLSSALPTVWLYRRSPRMFRPSTDHRRPLILLAAGTGIAPFLSFLETGRCRETGGSPGPALGAAWMVAGCRHTLPAANQLVRERRAGGGLNCLHVVFSGDGNATGPRYVQHVLRQEQLQLVSWLVSAAAVYVCGPPGMMAAVREEVLKAISYALNLYRTGQLDSIAVNTELVEMFGEVYQAVTATSRDVSSEDVDVVAESILKQMVKLGLYKTDVWC